MPLCCPVDCVSFAVWYVRPKDHSLLLCLHAALWAVSYAVPYNFTDDYFPCSASLLPYRLFPFTMTYHCPEEHSPLLCVIVVL